MKRFRMRVIVLASVGIVAGAVVIVITKGRVIEGGKSEQARSAVKSLPYLDWQPVSPEDIAKRGVTVHDRERSYQGLNIYNHDSSPDCRLMDMSGAVLHRWSRPEGDWHDVELLRDGDLLVLERDGMLLKLDWDSNVQWASDRKYHHDVTVAQNGDIYALTWDVLRIPFGTETIPIVNDYVTVLAPDGTVRQDISIFSLFGEEVSEEERAEILNHVRSRQSAGEEIEVLPQTVFDVFHTNTVDVLETDVQGVARKGDVLICIRNLDIVAVIDPSSSEVVWRLDRHDLDKPHQPSLVDGNLLIFDNGTGRGYSRVLEIDPGSGQTVWDYEGDPRASFFSMIRGGCQRLANGNTLIVESNKAHVFEVTPQGETVWEFYGTEVKEAQRRKRPIYRMARLAPDYLSPGILRQD